MMTTKVDGVPSSVRAVALLASVAFILFSSFCGLASCLPLLTNLVPIAYGRKFRGVFLYNI